MFRVGTLPLLHIALALARRVTHFGQRVRRARARPTPPREGVELRRLRKVTEDGL